MGSVWFVTWVRCLGIVVVHGLMFCVICHIWRVFTLVMLLWSAILVVLATWIWCSGSVLLALVVVLLSIIVVLAVGTSHWTTLIISPILAIIWALDMVCLNPPKLML
jgi:hypothetical protein